MARRPDPLSKRNETKRIFTGADVRREVEKLAASKRARVVRDGSEFVLDELQALVRAPMTPPAAYLWSIADITAARDAQMTGRFRLPARLAESMGTDEALFTARNVRLASVQSLAVEITAGRGPKADKIADEAEALFGLNGAALSRETETSLRSMLVDHGVAFGKISWTTRPDGSRCDPVVTAWPIEFVWWDAARGYYYTQVRRLASEVDPEPDTPYSMPTQIGSGYAIEAIVHGNGRWIVFQKSEVLPHRADAAVLPAALVWARHAFAMRDWAKGSAAHGNAKVVGELAEGTALVDKDGAMTAEATAFLALVSAIASQEAPVGIQPSGAKLSYLTNSSHAWEVWAKLADTAERASARIYLGSDGVLGAQGGAPGVDIQALLGVATSKVESDLTCIGRGLQTGLISPWAAINFGDDKQAPTRSYVFPRPEETQVRKDFGERNSAYLAAIKAARDAQLDITPDWLAACAKSYGVPPLSLADVAPAASTTGGASTNAASPPIYAYHLQYGVVSPNETRAQLRLPPVDGGDVRLTPPDQLEPSTDNPTAPDAQPVEQPQ